MQFPITAVAGPFTGEYLGLDESAKEGLLYSVDREEILKATGCSAAYRSRSTKPYNNKKCLTVSGPPSALENAVAHAVSLLRQNLGM